MLVALFHSFEIVNITLCRFLVARSPLEGTDDVRGIVPVNVDDGHSLEGCVEIVGVSAIPREKRETMTITKEGERASMGA